MKGQVKLKDGRTVHRYSDSFKLKVLEELSEGKKTKGEIVRHYGLGTGTIYNWMRKFRRLDLYNPKVYIKMPYEKDKVKALQEELAELKEAMLQTQVKALKAESDLEVALEMLGINKASFEKKRDAPPLKKQSKKAKG